MSISTTKWLRSLTESFTLSMTVTLSTLWDKSFRKMHCQVTPEVITCIRRQERLSSQTCHTNVGATSSHLELWSSASAGETTSSTAMARCHTAISCRLETLASHRVIRLIRQQSSELWKTGIWWQTNAWKDNSISTCKEGTENTLGATCMKTIDLKLTLGLLQSEKLKIWSEVCQTPTNRCHSKVDRIVQTSHVKSQRYLMKYRKGLAQL